MAVRTPRDGYTHYHVHTPRDGCLRITHGSGHKLLEVQPSSWVPKRDGEEALLPGLYLSFALRSRLHVFSRMGFA